MKKNLVLLSLSSLLVTSCAVYKDSQRFAYGPGRDIYIGQDFMDDSSVKIISRIDQTQAFTETTRGFFGLLEKIIPQITFGQ